MVPTYVLLENPEQIFDKSANLIRFPILIRVHAFQFGDHLGDFLHAGLQVFLGALQDGNQFGDFADGAFTLDAVVGGLHDTFGLFLGNDQVERHSGSSDGLR